jgi:uncharacterized protein YjbJ (UPF0337 family)
VSTRKFNVGQPVYLLPSASTRGRLTDDDLDVVNGRRDQLEGKIQERYGLAKDKAKQDVDAWSNSLTNIT